MTKQTDWLKLVLKYRKYISLHLKVNTDLKSNLELDQAVVLMKC